MSIVILTACTPSRNVNARTSTIYYVDNTCNYNGNGLSQDCALSGGSTGPFNSLSAAQSAVIGDQSGNQLLLRAGQTYSGQFTVMGYGTDGYPFTISSYGVGNKPHITGGKDNMMINCADCKHIIIDGLELSHSDRYGIIVKYPARNVTIQNSYIHHTLSGVVIWGSSNNFIGANEISWSAGDGLKVSIGNVHHHPTTNNSVGNNKIHHNMRYGILAQAFPSFRLDGISIYGNESYNNSTGIYLVYVNNGEIYENNLHNNGRDCQGVGDCIGEPYGFAIQSGSYNSFYDNIITRSTNTGIGVYGSQDAINAQSDGNKIYRNIVQGTLMGEWKRDVAWQCWPGNSVGNNNQIYNNIFFGDGMNFVIGDGNPSISGNVAFNNIFHGGSTAVYFEGSSTNAGWMFENNIFANNSNQSIYASHRYGGLTLQNNIYYKDTGGTLVKYNATSYTDINIRSIDFSAITSDPKFTGTSHWYDFKLQAGSPAIDSGVDIGYTYSLGFDPYSTTWPLLTLNQNDFGTSWEIGPFIFRGDTASLGKTSILVTASPTDDY